MTEGSAKLERKIKQEKKKLQELRAEVQRARVEVQRAEATLQAYEDALKLISPSPTVKRPGARKLRHGSKAAEVRSILLKAGKPLYIDNILKELGEAPSTSTRQSLAGTLSSYVRDGRIFSRPEPNTFGLLSLKSSRSTIKPVDEEEEEFDEDTEEDEYDEDEGYEDEDENNDEDLEEEENEDDGYPWR